MKPLKNLITNLTQNKNNNNNKPKTQKNRKPKRRIQRRTRKRLIIKNNPVRQAAYGAIPMAVPLSYRRYFTMRNLGETAVKISGCDLIYKIPQTLTALQDTNVMTVIPANPAYWTGTRIAALAQGYQNYRPLNLRIHYCPQCPVTQQGNVLGGTLWEDVPSLDSMQQSLKTSNGGFLTQCYQPVSTTIRLKSNLQINLYRMAGDMNQQSNPFYFIALSIATYNANNQLINPGIFYVEYTYILKNPIGVSTQYYNTGITTANAVTQYYTNAVAITCKELTIGQATYPPGTRLDVEMTDAQPSYYYNNTPLDIPTVPLWIFMNQPISPISQQRQVQPPEYTLYYEGVVVESTQVTIPPLKVITFLTDPQTSTTNYTVIYNPSSTERSEPIPIPSTDVYLTDLTENGVPYPIQIESSANNVVTATTNARITFTPLPGKKLIDYGIIGPDSKDPDFDSSKVHHVDD